MTIHRYLTMAFGLAAALICITAVGTAEAQTSGIRFNYPLGGERLHPGEFCSIRWTSDSPTGTVSIALWDGLGGTWSTIASNVPAAAGAFDWTVPDTMKVGELFRIGVLDVSRSAAPALTPTFFLIVPREPTESADVTALDAGAAGRSLQAVPNPAARSVTLAWHGGRVERLVLYDMLGTRVRTYEVPAGMVELQVDLVGLPNGAYVAEAQFVDGGKVGTKIQLAN